jgi:peptide/nickel transport system substrate-binding protein
VGGSSNAYYAKNVPIPKRNRAPRAAARSWGNQPHLYAGDADDVRWAEDRASRAGNGQGGGFDVKLQAVEFATSLDMADKGQFEAYVLAWSGRADPDGNLFSFDACKQPLNYAGYCKPRSTSC